MRRSFLALALISTAAVPSVALAQEDEDGGGFLTSMIEDALSSEDQTVRLFGFQGALSSRASFSRLTIADAEGVWLTVEGAELDWTRSALFGGRLVVNQLSAQRIDLDRLPPGEESSGSVSLPSPTSTAVNLPSLPVSVEIGRIEAAQLRLGPTVLGDEVLAALSGSLSLDSGTGAADILATRIDGTEGRLSLDAAFSNDSRDLKIDLELVEAEEGILANLLELPGRPSLEFSIRGAAPISDFTADILLETAGQPRLTGALRFMDLEGGSGLGWGLTLDGDVSPLFETRYQPFFGLNTALEVQGQNLADGGLRLDRLKIESSELDLDGSLELDAGGMPRRFNLVGALHPSSGGSVLLPLSGEETHIGNASLLARFDAADSEAFSVEADVSGFTRGDLIFQRGKIEAKGRIRNGAPRQVLADVLLDVTGLDLGDPALNEALAGRLAGTAQVDWTEGGALQITGADLNAGAGRLAGDVGFSGLEGNLRITTDASLSSEDFSPLSALAGQPLAGAATARVNGWYEPLGGAFDLTLDAGTRALALSPGLVNDLAGGDGRFSGRISRGLEGTVLDGVQIRTPQLSGTISGKAAPEAGDLAVDLTLADLALVYPALPGAASAKGQLGWAGEQLRFDLTGSLPQQIGLTVAGTAATSFEVADVTLDARVPDISVIVPQLSGPVTAEGSVALAGGVARLDLATKGPEGADLRLAGGYQLDRGTADLSISGSADLAIANRFTDGAATLQGQALLDLRLQGPAELASLSGALRSAEASVDLPGAGISIPRTSLALTLVPPASSHAGALLALRADLEATRIDAPGAAWAPLVDGPVTLGADLALLPGTELRLRNLALRNGDAEITGLADLSAGDARTLTADLNVSLARLERLRPVVPLDLSGALTGDVDLTYALNTGRLEAGVAAQTRALSLGEGPVFDLIDPDTTLTVTALLDQDVLTLSDLALTSGDARMSGQARMSPLSADPQITSDLRLSVGALRRLSALTGLPLSGSADVSVVADYATATGDLTAEVAGRLAGFSAGSGPAFDLLRGDADLGATLRLRDGALEVQNGRFRNPALSLTGDLAGERANLTASLDNLGRLVPQLPGPVSLRGSLGLANGYAPDLTITGPGGINAKVTGQVSPALVPDLSVSGTAPLAVVNPFLGTGVDVMGNVTADLALRSTLDLAGLSGNVRLANGRVAIAGASVALENFGADIALSGGQARVSAQSGFNTSGQATLEGTIGLTGATPMNLALGLRRVELVQQPTFRSFASGDLTVSGSLASGGDLTGRINLEQTEISLAFAGGGGSVIELDHVAEPAASRETRARAGLLQEDSSSGQGGGSSSQLNLNVVISAPNQVFVRGRGLDVELGGELLLTGRAGNVVTSGGFDLIRGRLDILGRRLDVTEGSVRLMGDLNPEVRLVATTQAEQVNVSIITEGTASAPKISLSSSPQMAEEEVLALLLFGRGLDKITPLQALQLANAVRSLLSGGEGVQGRLRQQFGLDELDVTTDAEGNVALKAGKYLSDNVYLNTEMGATGDVEIQLNLDVTPNLTARGAADSKGNTSLGIFFERDY